MLNISSAPVKFHKKAIRRPLSTAEKWAQVSQSCSLCMVYTPVSFSLILKCCTSCVDVKEKTRIKEEGCLGAPGEQRFQTEED